MITIKIEKSEIKTYQQKRKKHKIKCYVFSENQYS